MQNWARCKKVLAYEVFSKVKWDIFVEIPIESQI